MYKVMGRFIQGRKVNKDRQLCTGLYLQQMLEEKRQQKLKKKGMKSNGI